MYLIELLIPSTREDTFRAHFDAIKLELTERFGGSTAFLRSPAEGLWRNESGAVEADRIVVVEVMTEELDTSWWGEYRANLEKLFRQDEILIRASEIRRL